MWGTRRFWKGQSLKAFEGLRPVVFCPGTPHGKPGQVWRTWGTHPHLRAIVALADKADGRSTGNIELLCLNPYPQLFSEHHSQEAEQSDDWRGRTLYPDESVKNTHPETNYKR
jgi:hypothetical protein